MADNVPQKTLATSSADRYFGPGVVAFLAQINSSTRPTVITTPLDFPRRDPTPEFTALLASTGITDPSVMAGMKEDVKDQFSRAYYTTGTPPINVINVAEYHVDPADMFRNFANLPGNAPVKVPGSITDWRSLLLFHEQGHHAADNADVGRNSHSADIRAELQAEAAGGVIYRQALQAGVVKDPNVPDALSAARLISAISKPSGTDQYASAALTNSPLGPEMNKPGSVGLDAMAAAERGMNAVKGEIYAEAVRRREPEKYEYYRMKAMYESLGDHPDMQDLKTALRDVLKDVEAGKWGSGRTLREFAAQFKESDQSDEAKKRLQQFCSAVIGEDRDNRRSNPVYTPYLLEAAVAVNNRNTLADNPAAQTILNSFISATRTYAPGYFKDSVPSAAPAVAPKIAADTPAAPQAADAQNVYAALMERVTAPRPAPEAAAPAQQQKVAVATPAAPLTI